MQRALLLLLPALAVACGLPPSTPSTFAPLITVSLDDNVDDEEPVAALCAQGAPNHASLLTQRCAVSFEGEVRVVVSNVGAGSLAVKDVTLEGAGPLTFATVVDHPVALAAGESGVIVVAATSPGSATLHIRSNAENEPDLYVALTAVACRPQIVVAPEVCDFGTVDVGAVAVCNVSVRQSGSCELIVANLGFLATTGVSVFGVDGFVPMPWVFAEDGELVIPLTARPRGPGGVAGTFIIDSFDPERPAAEVGLNVIGN